MKRGPFINLFLKPRNQNADTYSKATHPGMNVTTLELGAVKMFPIQKSVKVIEYFRVEGGLANNETLDLLERLGHYVKPR